MLSVADEFLMLGLVKMYRGEQGTSKAKQFTLDILEKVRAINDAEEVLFLEAIFKVLTGEDAVLPSGHHSEKLFETTKRLLRNPHETYSIFAAYDQDQMQRFIRDAAISKFSYMRKIPCENGISLLLSETGIFISKLRIPIWILV